MAQVPADSNSREQPSPPSPRADPTADPATVQQLATILAAGLGIGTAASYAAAVLGGYGISRTVTRAAVALALSAPLARPGRTGSLRASGPASRAQLAAETAMRAAYLANAARRVQAAVDGGASLGQAVNAERRYMRMHLLASRNRQRAALEVDVAAIRTGRELPTARGGLPGRVMLSWRAHSDDRTTAECAAADGRNFPADQRPRIGWPGSVHPRCRCTAGPPIHGAGLVDQATAHLTSRRGAA